MNCLKIVSRIATALGSTPIGAAALLLALGAQGAAVSPFAGLSYSPSMQTGVRDTAGNMLAGTEVMHLVPYKGRLYASTSLWMEKDPAVPKSCQVLVLDSPKGAWRVDRQFTANNLRYGSLRTVTFTTDAEGHAIEPATLLLAAPDVVRGLVKIFCRDDASGEWQPSVLGNAKEYATTRAIGFHRDSVTGIDRIIAGNDHLGVLGGVYDPAAPGRVRWDKTGEFESPDDDRVMGFCNCNGILYCATSRHIFQRTDGAVPSWKSIYFCEKEIKPCGVRGLTAIPNPAGSGEVLIFTALNKVRRLDPANGLKETVEMDLPEFLTKQLGAEARFVLSAYNEFYPYTIPGTSEKVWLFGFEMSYARSVIETQPAPKLRTILREERKSYFAAEARYLIRHVEGATVRYEMAEVTDPREPMLVATRAIVVSPFPEDAGKAFYFSGYDCNSIPSHNTGWIYRGEPGAARASAQ